MINNVLQKLQKRYKRRRILSPQVVELLCQRKFPGNVREISNILERAFVLCRGEQIGIYDLPLEFREQEDFKLHCQPHTLKEAVNDFEKTWLERASKKFPRQVEIANYLGISQPSVARLMKKHNLRT